MNVGNDNVLSLHPASKPASPGQSVALNGYIPEGCVAVPTPLAVTQVIVWKQLLKVPEFTPITGPELAFIVGLLAMVIEQVV